MRHRCITIILALLVAAPLPFLVRPVAAAEQCFPQTGFCVSGRFLDYWQAHGGLAINGYPISGERMQQLEDGKPYLVQWFERVRLEYHPENAPAYQVLLGQFGRLLRPADPPANANTGATYFAETGHNVAGRFLTYWHGNGGLAQFGYPLSEAFWEILDDGGRYQVQYFERARFEAHPENAPPYDVLLGQFGRRILNWGGTLTYTYDLGTFPRGQEQDQYATAYDEGSGEYVITNYAPDTTWVFWNEAQTFTNATIDVDVRSLGGEGDSGFGLVFRVQPYQSGAADNEYYQVNIRPTGTFEVYRSVQEGGWVPIQEPVFSAAIRQGKAANHLTVTCVGPDLAVAINGQRVGGYGGLRTTGGWVGVNVETGAQSATVFFTNLRVSYPAASR